MHITRFCADASGESSFVDHEVPLAHSFADADGFTLLSSRGYLSKVTFSELPDGLSQTWHNAPRRQIVVILSGAVEVTTSDGVARRFGPGELFLADDTSGKGHLTRTVGGAARLMIAPLPPEFDISGWSRAS